MISDNNLKYYRLGFFITVLFAFLFQLLEPNVSIPYSLLGDLEIYTTTSALAALFLSYRASFVENFDRPSGPEIRKTRLALIWNSIAITINIVVMLIYFVFIPITKGSDGTMSFEYYQQYKTLALFMTLAVTIAHFFLSKFAMLETDCKWIITLLTFWAMVNLSVEYSTGLFFAELKGTKNIIKVSLAAFMIAATACLYLLICTVSQYIKGVNEEEQRNEAIKVYNETGRLETDDE